MPFVFKDESQDLPEIYTKRAKNELNEDPKQVEAHLTSFRRWISSMPHLKCPTDSTFLLAFLRQAKFNHSKAQKRLDNFCTIRTSEAEGCVQWFKEHDNDFDDYKALLDMKFSAPLGFTDNGSFIVLVKLANFDETKMSFSDSFRVFQIFNDAMILDWRCQIGGFGLILDYSNTTIKQAKAMFNPRDGKLHSKYYQEALPLRISRIFFYNMPSFFEGLFKVSFHYATEKMRKKYVLIENSFDEAYSVLPGLKRIMPKEYGGDNKSYDEIADENREPTEEHFMKRRHIVVNVDESKRPDSAKNLIRVYKDAPAVDMGSAGTYVKLSDEI